MSSPFDINVFYFVTIIILSLGIIGLFFGRNTKGALPAFIGIIFAILLVPTVSNDGTFAGVAAGADASVWPLLYLPILFAVFDAAIAIYSVTD